MAAPSEPPLDTARHIRYWQRCFHSVLPHHYTSNDSIRLTLGYFILAALDLLQASSPTPLITSADRVRLRAWVLSLQHPHGGFCGSPHHVLPQGYTTRSDFEKKIEVARDPANANIAATAFALLTLGVLAEEDGTAAFHGVDRVRTLRWLRTLQREDGSFGELITENGYVGGGRDMRYCYIAATIRWALGGAEGHGADDFDVDALVGYIRRGQTFDGGLSESSTHESHSGYAYCGVAALALLDLANTDPSAQPDHYIRAGIPSIPSLIHFLASRQFFYEDDDPSSSDSSSDSDPPSQPAPSPSDDPITGFNGRTNKVADTCYAWWVSGALSLLGQRSLVDRGPARRFLLAKTQHLIGGFAKHPGGPPDVYHAYMGLAALATLGSGRDEPGLKPFDPRVCASADVAAKINSARAEMLRIAAAADEEGSSADGDSGSE